MPGGSNEYRRFFNGEPCIIQMSFDDFPEVMP